VACSLQVLAPVQVLQRALALVRAAVQAQKLALRVPMQPRRVLWQLEVVRWKGLVPRCWSGLQRVLTNRGQVALRLAARRWRTGKPTQSRNSLRQEGSVCAW